MVLKKTVQNWSLSKRLKIINKVTGKHWNKWLSFRWSFLLMVSTRNTPISGEIILKKANILCKKIMGNVFRNNVIQSKTYTNLWNGATPDALLSINTYVIKSIFF